LSVSVWWFQPLWKIWVRQLLGLWTTPILNGKVFKQNPWFQNVPKHQPGQVVAPKSKDMVLPPWILASPGALSICIPAWRWDPPTVGRHLAGDPQRTIGAFAPETHLGTF
jgi:hypothetical protein